MTDQPALPFADAVAQRANVSVDGAAAVLDKYGVVASPQPPTARRLMVHRIAFRGAKRQQDGDEPFEFDWDVSDAGLWAIASEDNLVGKSTVLQVALWALRGKPKRITGTVRSWIREVEVSFTADHRRVDVAFQWDGEKPVGRVRQTIGTNTAEQDFVSSEQFQRVMQDVMLEALALEPIPSSRAGADGRVSTHEDGWLAYTGAFLSDSSSDAILGENVPNTDLTQRLLQVYLGLPWAMTLFQARSRARQLGAEAEQRRRRITALGNRSIEDLERDLADVQRQIADEGLRNAAAKELTEAQTQFDSLAEQVRSARREADAAASDVEDAKAAEIRAERTLNTLREDRAASLFLRRLAPVCCPRCDRPIGEQRRQMETSDRRCSVCTEELPQGEETTLEAEISEADERLVASRRLRADTMRAAADLAQEFLDLRGALMRAGERLQSASTAGTAADVQVLTRRAARLEGVLEVARSLARTDSVDATEISILQAAETEASARVSAAAESVLRSVSDEMKRIVMRLGMRGISRIELKRNAHVEVHQSGGVRKWGELATGEQLRLRLAAVVALVRSAREAGFGRHPGLLMIDSPGSEEMNAARVADVLDEVAELVRETEGLQVFVAMQGIEKASRAVPSRKLLTVGSGEFVW